MTVADDLGDVGLFAGIERSAIDELARTCFERRLARDQVLFVAGEPSDHLFVVRSGALRVVTSSPRGGQYVLSTVGPGQTLGELSILDGAARSADVVAAAATELIAIPAGALRTLLDDDPAALRAFAVELARNVRRLTGAMSDILFLDLPRRLAKLLLADAIARPDGTHAVRLTGSQSVLAARLGVTRQALNKALRGLARHGWIEIGAREVVLHDLGALARFVTS